MTDNQQKVSEQLLWGVLMASHASDLVRLVTGVLGSEDVQIPPAIRGSLEEYSETLMSSVEGYLKSAKEYEHGEQ
jgi:hypothetical protein